MGGEGIEETTFPVILFNVFLKPFQIFQGFNEEKKTFVNRDTSSKEEITS